MGELLVDELQNLMKLYRDGTGYVTSQQEFDDLTKGLDEEEKKLFFKKTFLLAVIKRTSDYIDEIEGKTEAVLEERAFKVAISLLMGALDIANIYEIDLSDKVLQALMEKFTAPV